MNDIIKRYEMTKKEFRSAEVKYIELRRKEFLERLLESKFLKLNPSLKEAIEKFNPVEAYVQGDVLLIDGYRFWADSIVFKNSIMDEKVVVTFQDPDFDTETISISGQFGASPFFCDKDGNKFNKAYGDVEVPYDHVIFETIEKTR